MTQAAAQLATGWRKATLVAGVIVPLSAVGLQVGTGGAYTERYYKERGERGYAFARYERREPLVTQSGLRTPVESLARVMEVFRPAVTELANIFGVSRQAIYDWRAGKSMAPENLARLEGLAKAADLLELEGIGTSSQLARRRISGNKTLFSLVRDGESAERTVQDLVEIVRREADERAAIERRLATRKRRVLDTGDLGAPILDETA